MEEKSLTSDDEKRKKAIFSASIESRDIKEVYNYMPRILQFLALHGLFLNSFLSVAGLNNKNNLFLYGVNAINGSSVFFYDVLNFSSSLNKRKRKIINENSKKSVIFATMLVILFLIHPLISLISDSILKKIEKNTYYSYLLFASVSTIQSVLSIFVVCFFMMSTGILINKINEKSQEKLRDKMSKSGKVDLKKLENYAKKREKITSIFMLIFGLSVIFSFSIINVLILKKLADLSKITEKTFSQKILFDVLTYMKYLMASIIIILGIRFAIGATLPMIKKLFEKVSENKEKEIKKKNTLALSVVFYVSTVGIFALSAYISRVSGRLDSNNIGAVFGYDVAKRMLIIMGIIANGLACYFIFKGVMSLDNSERLLEEYFNNEKKTLKTLEKIVFRNKTIGASLIIGSAIAVSGLLSTLIYSEVKNLDKISGFIKNPEFLASVSMVIATFIFLGISFYGKVNFLENKLKEFKEEMPKSKVGIEDSIKEVVSELNLNRTPSSQ